MASPCVIGKPNQARQEWERDFGRLPKGTCVCHRCDNGRCINREHLFIADYCANQTDSILKGRARWQSMTPRAIARARYRADTFYPHLNLGSGPS